MLRKTYDITEFKSTDLLTVFVPIYIGDNGESEGRYFNLKDIRIQERETTSEPFTFISEQLTKAIMTNDDFCQVGISYDDGVKIIVQHTIGRSRSANVLLVEVAIRKQDLSCRRTSEKERFPESLSARHGKFYYIENKMSIPMQHIAAIYGVFCSSPTLEFLHNADCFKPPYKTVTPKKVLNKDYYFTTDVSRRLWPEKAPMPYQEFFGPHSYVPLKLMRLTPKLNGIHLLKSNAMLIERVNRALDNYKEGRTVGKWAKVRRTFHDLEGEYRINGYTTWREIAQSSEEQDRDLMYLLIPLAIIRHEKSTKLKNHMLRELGYDRDHFSPETADSDLVEVLAKQFSASNWEMHSAIKDIINEIQRKVDLNETVDAEIQALKYDAVHERIQAAKATALAPERTEPDAVRDSDEERSAGAAPAI